MAIDAATIMQYVSAIAVGAAGTAIGFQQIMKRWKSTNAETTVLTLMREELVRMSTQNTMLSEYVHKLQLEANRISMELGKLQIENQKLHSEIVSLTRELIKLRTMLPKEKDGTNY